MSDIYKDLTARFIQKLETGSPDMKKQAEYNLTSYVRDRIREDGIARSQVLPTLQLADGQLDRDDDPTVLKYYMEVEPDSTATWVPFRGMAPSRFVKGRFAPVYFGKIESENFVVNIVELKNYRTDLRKILDDQAKKEIQKQEDVSFINQLNIIAAANPTEQDKHFFGGLTKINWATAQQSFFPDKPIKFALMNVRTAKEFYKWNYTNDMGFGPQGADMYVNGTIPKTHGLQVISTIKVDLVKDGEVFFLAPEDFIGKMLILQDATTFVEQRKDWLTFSTFEWVGIGIAITRSFTKNTFHS